MTRAPQPRTDGRRTSQFGPGKQKVIHVGTRPWGRGQVEIVELECGHAKTYYAQPAPEVGHYTRCAVCAAR